MDAPPPPGGGDDRTPPGAGKALAQPAAVPVFGDAGETWTTAALLVLLVLQLMQQARWFAWWRVSVASPLASFSFARAHPATRLPGVHAPVHVLTRRRAGPLRTAPLAGGATTTAPGPSLRERPGRGRATRWRGACAGVLLRLLRRRPAPPACGAAVKQILAPPRAASSAAVRLNLTCELQ